MPAVRSRLPLARGATHDFDAALASHDLGPLARGAVTTLQVNVGKLCNQACHHCHVEAGPKRTEIMTAAVADRVLEVLAASPQLTTLDLTGGAPELNPNFRRLVVEARRLGRRVIDRCNLTILFEPGMEELAPFLAEHDVEVVASLPCYTADNVEQQRGHGVFARSIAALHQLGALGYGAPGSPHALDLVYNPGGAFLPPAQAPLEATYRDRLRREHGVEFRHLLTITNMPIRRFADYLLARGEYDAYMSLLVNHLNPATTGHVMCRSLLSVGWDGALYDCDFNQMLELPVPGRARTIFELDAIAQLTGAPIATGAHCFGCTAGAGSSCGGSLA
ncbi:MAG: arsenosugar biosynthesis radical SAM protein ArsS [Proteobacteria bacterium]|nr:arsenosugar biosynthesis radical SAM protein ArsS [Pseudomonadota bacterium]